MKSGIFYTRLGVLACALSYGALVFAQADGTQFAQQATALPPLVVTATGFKESADHLPFGVSVITAQDIENSGVATVGEAVMKLLGVVGRMDLSGGNSYSLDLRGFGATADNNQVVIVDGRRINEPDLSGTALGTIPIDQVQSIQVIRGSAAVMYGDGATAGAIIVKTKAGAGLQNGNTAVVTTSLGNYGLQAVRTDAAVSDGALSFEAYGTDRKSDGNRQNFASDNNSAGATAQWSDGQSRFGVQTARNLLHSGLPGGLTADQYAANAWQSFNPTDFAQIKSGNTGVFWESMLGDWELGLNAGERTKQSLWSNGGYLSTATSDTTSYNLRARRTDTGSQLGNALTLGLDNENWISVDYADSHAKSNSDGVYVNDDLSILATGTHLSAGLRNEKVNRVKDLVAQGIDATPSAWDLGVTQDVGANAQAFARTGQSFRLPNSDEFSFVTPGTALQMQTSRDSELGGRWHTASTRLELRWYRSELNNEIAYDSNAVGPYSPGDPGADVNLDPTLHRGVEFDAHHELNDQLALRFNVAQRDAIFLSGAYAGNTIALVPSQTAAVGLEVKPAPGHTVDLGVNWVARQYADFSNQCEMPAYSTVDARYGYSSKTYDVSLAVANLADTRYFSQAFGCTGGVIQSIYPEPGRAVTATIKLKF